MGKRLTRISSSAIAGAAKLLLGEAANVVLKTGAVSNGYVHAIDTIGLVLMNKRNTKLRFSFDEINEIILDKSSHA